MPNLPADLPPRRREGPSRKEPQIMPSPSRSPLALIALAIATSFLLAALPLAAQPGPNNFKVIKQELVMEEIALELPVPDYEFVDVLGTFKNAPNSVACGGTVSEGAAQDADLCRLQAQLQFQNGYLVTDGKIGRAHV